MEDRITIDGIEYYNAKTHQLLEKIYKFNLKYIGELQEQIKYKDEIIKRLELRNENINKEPHVSGRNLTELD